MFVLCKYLCARLDVSVRVNIYTHIQVYDWDRMGKNERIGKCVVARTKILAMSTEGYVYVYVWVCVCMWVNIYVYTQICMYVCKHMYMYMSTDGYVYIYMCIHRYVCM